MSSSSTAAATAAATTPANPRSRVILASLIGTTIEFYDFYVYATAAVLVFPHLFFPAGIQFPREGEDTGIELWAVGEDTP